MTRRRTNVYLEAQRYQLEQQLEAAERELHQTRDELREWQDSVGELRVQVDGFCARLDRMGEQMGAAKCREVRMRLIAETAICALDVLTPAAHGHKPELATTMIALAAHCRSELAKLEPPPAAHARESKR